MVFALTVWVKWTNNAAQSQWWRLSFTSAYSINASFYCLVCVCVWGCVQEDKKSKCLFFFISGWMAIYPQYLSPCLFRLFRFFTRFGVMLPLNHSRHYSTKTWWERDSWKHAQQFPAFPFLFPGIVDFACEDDGPLPPLRIQQVTGAKCPLQISSGSAVSGACCPANLFLYAHPFFIIKKYMFYFVAKVSANVSQTA